MERPLIPYYRVSTERQGKSGLGLDAQQSAVKAYAKANGLRILASYTEIESGKVNERPQLRAALTHAKRSNAVLCVAKLDRLSRSASFLLNLVDSRVPFVCCDSPFANELTIGVMAVMAQHERKMIAERTRAALQAAKARGVKLGSLRTGHWTGHEQARLKGAHKGNEISAKVRAELATKAHEELRPIIEALLPQNLTLDEMAARLNLDGWRTRRGREWNKVSVCRFLAKCSRKERS